MMNFKFFIRLDDACPRMHSENWKRVLKILNTFDIKPIIAVIPDNQDESLMYDKENEKFWNLVKDWQNQDFIIGLHGYQHNYVNNESGILKINNFSEFSALTLADQVEKISKAFAIFKSHEIKPKVWIAPGHSFDLNTLKAIKTVTKINIVSDGFDYRTYFSNDFFWIPAQINTPFKMPFGLWTFCLHPNTMSDNDFRDLEMFLSKNSKFSENFNELFFDNKKQSYLGFIMMISIRLIRKILR